MNNFLNRLIYGKSNKPDYTKDDIKRESNTKRFFDILGVKYPQLIKLNLVVVVFAIPLIFWTWISFFTVIDMTGSDLAVYKVIYTAILVPCLCILAAPLAGITSIIKNFTQDRHVWMWKDFIKYSKENAKQATLYMLIFGLVLLFGQVVLSSYSVIMGDSSLILIMRTIFLVIYVLAGLSIMYAFPMLVTYELKLRHIIKNSLLMTIGLLKNTIILIFLVALPLVIFMGLSMTWGFGIIIFAVYYILFGAAFTIYIIVSNTATVFQKHLAPSENSTNTDIEASDK